MVVFLVMLGDTCRCTNNGKTRGACGNSRRLDDKKPGEYVVMVMNQMAFHQSLIHLGD